MDFIAIDLDKYDVWEAFRQPVPVKAQMYVKTVNWEQDSPPPCVDVVPGDDTICTSGDKSPKQRTIGTASPTFGNQDPGGTYQEPGSDPNLGFGQGGLTEEQKACIREQKDEVDVDAAAQAAADEIRMLNTPTDNPDNLEIGSFIIRLDNGNIVFSTPTFGGSTGTVSLDRILRDARNEFGTTIDQSNIVGILHLHPAEGGPGFVNAANLNQLSALDLTSTFPSSRFSGGLRTNRTTGQTFDPWDWASGERFLTNGGHRTSVDDVSLYILGPDGMLREYDYSDPNPDAPGQPLEQRINEAESDAGGQC